MAQMILTGDVNLLAVEDASLPFRASPLGTSADRHEFA